MVGVYGKLGVYGKTVGEIGAYTLFWKEDSLKDSCEKICWGLQQAGSHFSFFSIIVDVSFNLNPFRRPKFINRIYHSKFSLTTASYQNYSMNSSISNVNNQYKQCISDLTSFNVGNQDQRVTGNQNKATFSRQKPIFITI